MGRAPGHRHRHTAFFTSSPPPPATSYDFTAPLSIIRYPDPRLRAVNARVGFFDDNLAALARALFDAMYASPDDGVGLAAPQAGINLRLMVFNPEGDPAKPEAEVVLVNPRVVSTGGPLRPYEEGCLSFPGIFGDVVVREGEREEKGGGNARRRKPRFNQAPSPTLSPPPPPFLSPLSQRPSKVKIKAQRLDGSQFTTTLDGWPARIFQHEFDHLQGVLFVDRMEADARDGAGRRLATLEAEFAAANPGVAYEGVRAAGEGV